MSQHNHPTHLSPAFHKKMFKDLRIIEGIRHVHVKYLTEKIVKSTHHLFSIFVWSEKPLSSPERIRYYWIFTKLGTYCKADSNLCGWFHPQSDLTTTVHGWATVLASVITASSTASSSHCLSWHLSYLAVSSRTLLCVSILILHTHTHIHAQMYSVVVLLLKTNKIIKSVIWNCIVVLLCSLILLLILHII